LSAEDFVIESADDYDSDFVLYGGGLKNGYSVYQWRIWQRADDLDSIARESKLSVDRIGPDREKDRARGKEVTSIQQPNL